MIKAQLSTEKVFSNTAEAFTLYAKSRLGERKASRIEYSPIETLFLVSEKKMQVFSRNKKLSEDALIRKFKRSDKKIETKLLVYTNLRKKGYILKTALKYGADFRVYEKSSKPGEEHARWILFVTKESHSLSWHDFAAKNRIAHSTKKNLLIAIVDEEEDISYYEVSWLRP